MPHRALRILVTAGPTHEPIDPVRYIGNRSSGRTGYALAVAAHSLGHEVELISGPVNLPSPEGIPLQNVETAAEMRQAVLNAFACCDVVIMAAAVADFRPSERSPIKLKKTDEDVVLHLSRNPDILRELGELKEHQKLVGFALETHEAEASARRKFEAKNLDLLVLNGPGNLEGSTGTHQILTPEGFLEEATRSKAEFAHHLIKLIETLDSGRN